MAIYIKKDNQLGQPTALMSNKTIQSIYVKQGNEDAVCVWGVGLNILPFTYTKSTTAVTITGLKEGVAWESLTIPETIEDLPVTQIATSAFKNKTVFKSIELPNSLKDIGNEAFYGCTGLTSITLPNSVKSIGAGAFSGCTGLTSVTIPNSVTSIGGGAFSGCSSLESITIPFVGAKAGVTSSNKYQYPFGYMFGTGSYTGGVATRQYYYGDSTYKTTYSTYYIPSSLKSVIVTGGNILFGAFSDCSGLTSITIGNSVTSIGDSAFIGCSGLTSITVADGNTIYHSKDNCLIETASKILILGCKTSVIPSDGSVTSIDSSAFKKCTGLTSITIPNGVTSIGKGAFNGCSSLESITIPFVGAKAGVTSSDTYQYPFGYIFGTSDDDGSYSAVQYYYGDSTSSTTYSTYYIPSSLKSVIVTGGNILYGAFSGCRELTSIAIPDNVTSIGGRAFYACNGLTNITIPDGVTSIGGRAFYLCSGLTSVTIPNSVTSIDYDAFYYCSSLTSITFNGTIAQWNAISKGTDWNYNTGNYTIHCTDGDIPKQ